MKKRYLDFKVDTLTSSIENVRTGEVFETEIMRVLDEHALRKGTFGWAFDWVTEWDHPNREVYALFKKGAYSEYHGLVSCTDKGDHIFMDLLENAPSNKGRAKLYSGVAANLVAFLCKKSLENGYRGVVAFEPKTKLIEHYEKMLGAQRFAPNKMFINTKEAYALIHQYFPDFFHDRL
ncbi:MAG TPA: hypothetical protein VFH95_00775 [Candidatus Kapabacteria bacterium]|nr:hypothetical protein [Candidatus Kapabacteria bacterium]